MTDRAKIPDPGGQYDYWSDTEEDFAPASRVRSAIQPAYRSRRVVSTPESDPVAAWQTFDQHKQRRRRERAQPEQQVKFVPRRLAQSATQTSSARLKALRQSTIYHTSSIPARSGQRARKRGLFWKLLGALAIGACLLVGSNFVLTSSSFRIKQITVTGTHNAALIQAIQRMGAQGQNIFAFNSAGLTSRIEAQPRVASVMVSKQWPNQLTVTVKERRPVLLWQTPEGTYSLDAQGVVIAPISASATSNPQGTVILSAQQPGAAGPAKAQPALHPGMHIDKLEVAFALQVIKYTPQIVGVPTFKLYYDGTMYGSVNDQAGGASGSRGSYVIESPDGWKAILGGPADANPLDNRLIELREILVLAQKERLTVASIDLRYGLRPVFTLQQ